jgi:hypothetical protein
MDVAIIVTVMNTGKAMLRPSIGEHGKMDVAMIVTEHRHVAPMSR